MNRDRALAALDSAREPWDLVVVGGGATGLGVGVDAAARGHRVALVERHDFAQGTSSRSTKLVHGGVRYLRQGHLGLVVGALRERARICRNAPHLARELTFVIPTYRRWETGYYGAGLKLYDALAGRYRLGPSRIVSRDETLRLLPTVAPSGLRGGVSFVDAQFDDARLAIALARTLVALGGVAVNHCEASRLLARGGRIHGIAARDVERGREHEIEARVVVNATGVFVDAVRRLDEPGCASVVSPSQGAHVVLPRRFLPGEAALLLPRTKDGRVLFALPWHDRVIVGTTETAVAEPVAEPVPLEAEIDFLLEHAAECLVHAPSRDDVLSCFAGLRPLVRRRAGRRTAALSRDHSIFVSDAGLLSVTGGKWTTYRQIAEDVVNRVERMAGLERQPCRTADLPIHGATTVEIADERLRAHGWDAPALADLERAEPELAAPLAPGVVVTGAQVAWAARFEMARTVEDVLARRTRALLLDARASVEAAGPCARILARELGRDAQWEARQVEEYRALAERHVPRP